ncbi:allantoicase [Thalassolituus maritimus]|uniref:Probable allantoicase n=1 Tax=Thalassolituus maritimus TaxID=484498 RepID=A0A1N7KQB8_9GAMM|nr:allantoicase [Thalassolituus maritimus]SIS63745.1 allantoicase [Thalassolituus maritimus]
MNASTEAPAVIHTHIDLLGEKYGGQALSCNDEFFAEASNMVKREEPVFIADKYTDRGKWMDGWESRRRRTEGHDWCILRLGVPGRIKAFDVNTTHFRGNAPAQVSIEGYIGTTDPGSDAEWQTILEVSDVSPHSHNFFEIDNAERWTHLRLNILPDGGVARLRVYGEPIPDWSTLLTGEVVDLAACTNGGRAVDCSDMFFSPMNNLLAPGRGINMGDGWETRRRRTPGKDWIIVRLGTPGKIARLLVDTCHFKGNYPDTVSLEGTVSDSDGVPAEDAEWVTILDQVKTEAHTEHYYQEELQNTDVKYTHVRLNIFPDGGVSRLRVYGYPELD